MCSLLLTCRCCICIVGNVCFLHVAILVRYLREQVVLRLKQQHPKELEAFARKIPSESYTLYQFFPKHPLYAASLHYIGKAIVKNKVRLRALRARHVNSLYYVALKNYTKHMGARAATLIESHTPEYREPACVSLMIKQRYAY